jgi:hypothetical protein
MAIWASFPYTSTKGGDFTKGNGTGGKSIYGDKFEGELSALFDSVVDLIFSPGIFRRKLPTQAQQTRYSVDGKRGQKHKQLSVLHHYSCDWLA